MSAAIRVGVVGYGLAGSVFHAPLVASTPGMTVAAIVTSSVERQAHARAAYPSAAILGDMTALVGRRGELDLVVVATPNRHHAEIAVAALEAGLAVVIDKPMAPTRDEVDLVLTAAERARRLVTVFHNRRWDGDFLTARRVVESGALGPVVRLESRYERFRPSVRGAWRDTTSAREGGGVLYDLGAHLVDQAMQLFGSPLRVHAEVAARRPGATVDDDAFMALEFAGGEIAHLWMSQLPRRPGARFRLIGLLGVFEKDGLDPQEDALRAGRRPIDADWGREPPDQWGRLYADEGAGRPIETLPGSYQVFYAGVRDALVTGGPAPVDARDAARVVDVLEAAHRSATTRETVDLT